jgi:predicted AlkP superfamily pyrophosphatase or phosphodiesterase
MRARPAETARALFAAALLLFAARGCSHPQPAIPVITVEHGPNSAEQIAKPYVVLVSLDGYRYDYPKLYGATHLEAIGERGASAPDGMIPAYPSITFPNHYTIVTGLYPEHHGIVANRFYDPQRKQHYASSDPATVTDGSWYGGVPLWSLAEKQGMRSACFFWPGSEAEIAGERPSYYLRFDNQLPDDERVEQVIAWLKLPAPKRPHFITLYFSNTDRAGHMFGPDSPQTAEAARYLDGVIGTLENDLSKLHLRIDLIVVADHGMETVQGGWIDLDHYADLADFETDGALLYPKNDTAAEAAYEHLRGASDNFEVYRRGKFPPELHFDSSDRAGDPIVLPTGPYLIRAHAGGKSDVADIKGEHGYDPYRMKSMRAIFFAEGPDIRPGSKVAPFEDINIYPLIAKVLGLQIGDIDGNLKVLQGILQTSAGN